MAKIHLTYYKGEDNYTEGLEVERDILHYVIEHNESEYSDIIKNDNRWTVFYHLTDMRKALLGWYPFDSNAHVLEIGAGMGALTGLLCEKCAHVTAVELSKVRAQAVFERNKSQDNLDIYVGNITDMSFKEQFDYITVIGVLEYQGNYSSSDNPYLDFLKDIKHLLKPDGKILLAIENKFGIKYWCGVPEDHTGKVFDSINGYPGGGKARTFDKAELKSMLAGAGLEHCKFYYPMPDYKLPQVIFTDSSFPDEEMPHRVIPYYLYYPTLIAKEKDLYNNLLKNKVFGFFANSFLIECGSENAKLSRVSMATITADRKPTHQMATVIYDDTFVIKQSLRKEGRPLLEDSYHNIEELRQKGIPCVPTSYSSEGLKMPYLQAPLLEDIMLNALRYNQLENFYNLVDEYYNQILNSSSRSAHINVSVQDVISRHSISAEMLGPILSNAYIDFLPHNCFEVDGQFVLFDQEFKKENYPARFILFRAFKNLYGFNHWIESIIPFNKIKEKYGLIVLWDAFEEIDKSCLCELTDEGISERLGGYWYVDPQTIEQNAEFLLNRLSYESHCNDMRAQLEEAQQRTSAIQDEKFLLENRINGLSKEIDLLTRKNSRLSDQILKLENENLDLSQKNEEKCSELENQLSDYVCATEKLHSTLQAQTYKMADLNEKLEASKERIQAAIFNKEAALRAKDAEIAAIRTSVDLYYHQAKEFEDKYNAINNATFWKATAPLRKLKDRISSRNNHTVHTASSNEIIDAAPVTPPCVPQEEKYVRPCPESAISGRQSIEELCATLLDYDVVSFDVFDTLVYRGFSRPEDIFSVVGLKIGYLNFKKLRVEAEREARRNTQKANGEINIYDIYSVLSKYIHIDIEETIAIEFQTELEYLYANPYMYEVYKEMSNTKKVIYVSDMYWPHEYLDRLLEHCGYDHFDQGFVSCEFECGKGNGELQKIANTYFCNKKIIHIGDNYQSDVIGSQKMGWEAIYYKNSNEVGNPHRPKQYDSLVGSVYKSIVNYHLHASDRLFSKDYEHGFLYGGILNCGFCEWLNEYGRNHKVDKLLFLARDCDIVSKVYNQYYRQIDNEYVIVSRFAIFQATFEDNPEEYIQNFFLTRANIGTQTIEEALRETDLSCLIDKLPPTLSAAKLTVKTYESVRTFLYDNIQCVADCFKSTRDAAIRYYSEKIGDAKRICLVDLGWGGTILVHMRQLIQRYVAPDCEVVGTYVAAATNENTNLYVSTNIMQPFLFSFRQNRDLRIFTDTEKGAICTMFIEALFSSDAPTLLKYSLTEDGTIDFVYGHYTSSKNQIKKMQQGILDFAKRFNEVIHINKEFFSVSAVEAFTPLDMIKLDFEYNCKIFRNVKEFDFALPRVNENQTLTTLGDIVAKKGFI